MNAQNIRVVDEVLAAIAELEAGSTTVADLQATLQSAVSRFENDGSGIADLVWLAEADLEAMQSTILLDEQLPAAILRLDGCDRASRAMPVNKRPPRRVAVLIAAIVALLI